jgi:hypothetical protein
VAIPCWGSSSTLVDVLLLLVNCGSIAARPSCGKSSIADEVAQLRVGDRVDQHRRETVLNRLVIFVAVSHVLVSVANPQLHARVVFRQGCSQAAHARIGQGIVHLAPALPVLMELHDVDLGAVGDHQRRPATGRVAVLCANRYGAIAPLRTNASR